MTGYTEMMEDFLASGPGTYTANLPDMWKQGRTAFGGITSALLLAAILNEHDDLPPLRTMQINFIGPAVDELTVASEVLRRGKNNVTLRAELDSAAGAGTHGYFTFGVERALDMVMDYPLKDITQKPDDIEPYQLEGGAPNFLVNFDRRWVSGPKFFEQADDPDMLIWTRLTDPASWDKGLLPLVVLADAPPAAFGTISGVRALSSMNWNVNFLTNDFSTENGWWLMRSATRFIRDGYSSQLIQVWNSEGRRVMDAAQHVAIFQ
jgi:acyl-CoA thioesterase